MKRSSLLLAVVLGACTQQEGEGPATTSSVQPVIVERPCRIPLVTISDRDLMTPETTASIRRTNVAIRAANCRQ